MGCLRCGRETENGKTFCQDCLASMDAYPVKPDEAIYLPSEKETAESKKQAARRKAVPLSQQLEAAKRQIRNLRWLTTILLAVIAVLCVVLFL